MTSPSRISNSSVSVPRSERPSYMALSTVKTPPAHLIRSRNNAPHDLSVPGPGSYDIHDEWRGNALAWRPNVHKSPSDIEKEIPSTEQSPVRSQLSSRSTTFGARFSSSISETPGPCTYSPRKLDIHISPRVRCTFGSSSRADLSPKKKNETPGPGAYEIPVSPRKGVVLKSRLRVGTFETPGPGQYETKTIVGTGLAKTIGAKC